MIYEEVWAYTNSQPQRPAGSSRACRSLLRGYFSQSLLHWLHCSIPHQLWQFPNPAFWDSTRHRQFGVTGTGRKPWSQ